MFCSMVFSYSTLTSLIPNSSFTLAASRHHFRYLIGGGGAGSLLSDSEFEED